MKVQPNIFNVQLDNVSVWQGKESEFIASQEKYKALDFITLATFNASTEYSQDLLTETTLVLSDDQILQLALLNIPFTVKQKIIANIDITRQLIELAEKPIRLTIEKGNTYNSKCEVHMPGQALSLYNETQLLEDACTDALQSSLNSGWRIIAACPQPDNRRPDYILGRFNPDLDVSGYAERDN